MSYTIYGTDVNRFFAIIDVDVLSTYKNIIGVVDSTYGADVYIIFNGNVTNYGSATWTAYRRYDNKPDNPWGSGTFGNVDYIDAYDITLVNCPQTLTGPYVGGANLVGTSLSDLYSKARNYFDNPTGQGAVTLTIKRPGQTLNFASRLLGKTIRQYISSDATIDIRNASSDWEILWQFNFGGDNGQILINSDFEAINDLLTNSLTGDLLRSTYESSANNVYAQKNIVAKSGNADGLSAFTNVSADQMFAALSYDRLIIAKSGSGISMPFEVGFHWQVGQSMRMCVVKRDGTFVAHGYSVAGEFITVGFYGFTTTAFNGTLKYYYATDPGSSLHQEGWVELAASVAQNVSLNVNMFIVFAIPS